MERLGGGTEPRPVGDQGAKTLWRRLGVGFGREKLANRLGDTGGINVLR